MAEQYSGADKSPPAQQGPPKSGPSLLGDLGPSSMPHPVPGSPVPLPPVPKWHDVKIRRKRKIERCIVSNVPPEEFGVSRFARDIKNCPYCFHDVIKTQADLVRDGFDPDQIDGLMGYNIEALPEALARDTVMERTGSESGDIGLNKWAREIRITEHYCVLDYEGDGNASLYKVTTAGSPQVILRRKVGQTNKFSEDIVKLSGPPPFACITPNIITHRFYGRSIADMVMDIMRIKTVLLRGALDCVYLRNNPRLEIPESHASDQTVDDAISDRIGGIIRTKMPGGIDWHESPDVIPGVLPMIQYMDTLREWRTGMVRQGQGVDGNALQNQVATIANQMEDASQKKIVLIARIFAETGIKDLFQILHNTLRRHGTQVQTVRLRSKWVPIDPRQWKLRDTMTTEVGLGPNEQAIDFANLNLLIAAQTKAVQIGMVSKRNFWNTAAELVQAVRPGHDPSRYFTDPGAPVVPDPNNPQQPDPADRPIQPPSDPKQLQAQVAQQKAQGDVSIAQQKLQHDAAMKMADAQMKKEQTQASIITEQTKAQNQAMLDSMQAKFDQQLEALKAMTQIHVTDAQQAADLASATMAHNQKLQQQSELHQQKTQHNQQMHEAKLEQLKAAAKAKPKRENA